MIKTRIPMVFFAAFSVAGAQTAAPDVRAFEVVSIRPNNSPDGGILSFGPDSIDSAHFDVATRGSSAVPLDTTRLMLRKLLEDRFGLKAHQEMRDLPVYALVVGKNGPRHMTAPSESGRGMQPGAILPGGAQRWTMNAVPMSDFAAFLGGGRLDRPVVDLTRLAGSYDFVFDIPARDPGTSAVDHQISVVFPAVYEQLGLRVEPRTAPVEIVVIDHAEKLPTAN